MRHRIAGALRALANHLDPLPAPGSWYWLDAGWAPVTGPNTATTANMLTVPVRDGWDGWRAGL